MSKGPNANSTLAAMSGNGNVAVKPLVKHVLSKELQLYFEKVCGAFLDECSEEYRTSGYSSLREDPGLHQLVPYFVQFISEKVTHGMKDIFVLTQVMRMAEALVQNQSLYVDPYVSSSLSLYLSLHFLHSVYVYMLIIIIGRLPRPLHPNLPDRPPTRRQRRPVGAAGPAGSGRVATGPHRSQVLARIAHAQTPAGPHLSQDLPGPVQAVRRPLRGHHRAARRGRRGGRAGVDPAQLTHLR